MNIYRIVFYYIGVIEILCNVFFEIRGLCDFLKGESGIKCDCIIWNGNGFNLYMGFRVSEVCY